MTGALRWTGSGAVPSPETLQLRVARGAPERLRAGAPEPARALSTEEALANVRWFATAGTRGRAVTTLVLSGLGAEGFDPEAVTAGARDAGLRRVVWHTTAEQARTLAGRDTADELAVVVRADTDLAGLEDLGPRLHLVVPLEAPVLSELAKLLTAVAGVRPARSTLAWPFPGPDVPPPPSAPAVIDAVRAAVGSLGGASFQLRGLPACAVGPERSWPPGFAGIVRSANRWYVDADHQKERALLFHPEVLRFAKRDSCRFCDADPRCDGVAAAWLSLGLAGALLPIREGLA